ncbi:MAG: hypothetical protein HUJ26_06950 [Planctomycetaceae bacterium]|nr:hypothetical protein [Planctomycetaceae bacterium]
MSEYEPLNPDQNEFEDALRQLQPSVSELDPARLMFQAGRNAALQESHARLRRWQISTLVTSACALLAVTILWPGFNTGSVNDRSVATQQDESETPLLPEQHSPETPDPQEQDISANSTTEAVVQTETPTEIQSPSPLNSETPAIAWWNELSPTSENSTSSYLTLRNRVLRDGLDAFPEPDFSPETTYTGSPVQREPLSVRDGRDPELWNQI